jgi:dolichol-phosphate mannosyltransferase
VINECELSIILPAFREADTLRHLLPRIAASAGTLTPDYEILVVDAQHAVDDTREVCAKCGVRHLFRAGGDNYGDAVRSGIRESRGRYVVIMDADGSHAPEDFVRLWPLRDAWDVVIASRYASGGKTEVHAGLTMMSLFLNAVYRTALGLKIRDMSNSFRLYRGSQLRALTLEATNFEIVEEILAALVWGPMRSRITEIPITFERRHAGESKRNHIAFAFSYLRSIHKLRRFRADALSGRSHSPSD